MPRRAVFVHGAGRSGPAAWPLQREAGLAGEVAFVERAGFGRNEAPQVTDQARDVAIVVEACRDGAHVVAHSYGALAALGAADAAPTVVRSLVLLEPAAFALARGGPAVEAHVAAVDPVMKAAPSMSAGAFVVALYTAFGIPDAQAPGSDEELRSAERLRLHRAPWLATLNGNVIRNIPTLVVTGNWNPEYEEIATVLVSLGARHIHVEGSGHNPAHSPDFNRQLTGFWSELD